MSIEKSTRTYGCGGAGLAVSCAVMTFSLLCRASTTTDAGETPDYSDLRIYMPREVTVEADSLELGQISIVRGARSLAATANKIEMGRFSVPGQEILVDRHTVLSRPACNGIPTSSVTLTGAEKTAVRQKFQVVRADQFLSLASSFIKSHYPQDSGCQWNPVRKPKDLAVPGIARSVKFLPRLARSNVRNQAGVEIEVLSGDEKIGTREVLFEVKYGSRRALAKVDIAAGEILGPDNVRIEEETSSRPEPTDWKSPYGLVAKRPLRADTVIRPHMVGLAETPVIVKRNQSVVIRVESPGFLITAAGVAMLDGKAGEIIKVRNADSQRIIVARINDDGSVEPVL